MLDWKEVKPLVHALGFSAWKRPLVRRFLHDCDVVFVRRENEVPQQATLAVWASGRHRDSLAERTDVKRLMLEDGFLRSVGLGADLTTPLSWVVDTRGIYYDASRQSDLEMLLQTGNFDAQVISRARAVRKSLETAGITKYNVGNPSWGGVSSLAAKHDEVVLVAGQVETDASIRTSTPGIKTNMTLLHAARTMHPRAWLVYKPHPDVVAGLRNRGADEPEASKLCDEIVLDAPMGRLLQDVDVVHVMTSLTGFEALIQGKTVVCHGQPFYAGWGLTRDVSPIHRRTRKLELDQLLAGALIQYPRYVRRDGFPCTVELAIADLLSWKKNRSAAQHWAQAAVRPFLRIGKGLTQLTEKTPVDPQKTTAQ